MYLLGPTASLAQVCFIIEWPPSLTNESPPTALKSTTGWDVSGEGPQHHSVCPYSERSGTAFVRLLRSHSAPEISLHKYLHVPLG